MFIKKYPEKKFSICWYWNNDENDPHFGKYLPLMGKLTLIMGKILQKSKPITYKLARANNKLRNMQINPSRTC
jgi:hypothetical protein